MSNPPHQSPVGAAAKVSAVILSFNRAEALGIVLDRLGELPLHEVVVADSGTDGSADLARSYPGVKVLQMEDIGTACRNVGAGRLSEPAKIIEDVTSLLTAASQPQR